MIITNAVALLCSGGAALLRPVYQLKSNQMQYSIPDWQKKLYFLTLNKVFGSYPVGGHKNPSARPSGQLL